MRKSVAKPKSLKDKIRENVCGLYGHSYCFPSDLVSDPVGFCEKCGDTIRIEAPPAVKTS
jgi:hypothetical protein